MSDQNTGGSTGRWLKRITQSMSGEPRDLAELIEDLREASERGLFDGDALVMLEGVLAVADMQVRDIMVPRSQMVFVERDEPPEKLVALVVESGHSRFPVIGEDRDQISASCSPRTCCGCRRRRRALRDPRVHASGGVRAGEQAAQRAAQGISPQPQPHRHGGG
jgi:CBS domain-containing protein